MHKSLFLFHVPYPILVGKELLLRVAIESPDGRLHLQENLRDYWQRGGPCQFLLLWKLLPWNIYLMYFCLHHPGECESHKNLNKNTMAEKKPTIPNAWQYEKVITCKQPWAYWVIKDAGNHATLEGEREFYIEGWAISNSEGCHLIGVCNDIWCIALDIRKQLES